MNIIKTITINWRSFIACYILLAVSLDSLCYTWAHDLLGDFLEGSIGHNKAKTLRKQQKIKSKLLLNYIPAEIRKNQTTFRKYYRLYQIWLFSRIIVVILFLSTLVRTTDCQTVLLLVNTVAAMIIAIIFRAPSWPGSTSSYSGRRKK